MPLSRDRRSAERSEFTCLWPKQSASRLSTKHRSTAIMPSRAARRLDFGTVCGTDPINAGYVRVGCVGGAIVTAGVPMWEGSHYEKRQIIPETLCVAGRRGDCRGR